MGFRGSRVQIPPSRLGPRLGGGLVVTARLPPPLATLAALPVKSRRPDWSNPKHRWQGSAAFERISAEGTFERIHAVISVLRDCEGRSQRGCRRDVSALSLSEIGIVCHGRFELRQSLCDCVKRQRVPMIHLPHLVIVPTQHPFMRRRWDEP